MKCADPGKHYLLQSLLIGNRCSPLKPWLLCPSVLYLLVQAAIISLHATLLLIQTENFPF